jgi:hypothetical protein
VATAKGVDVSHWQTLNDWSITGLSFVIAKASEGTTPDPMYSKHAAKGRAAGLVVGAYAFNRNDVDMNAQVQTFATASAGADLFFIDVEGVHAFTQAQTAAFISKFRALTGKHIGLYHSESGYFNAGQDYDWVAHWGVAAPTHSWDFHQYRGSPLDLDQYNGTTGALQAFVSRLNGGDVPTLTAYLPGYTATVGVGARVRTEPTLTATVIRTTTKSENWTITGWAKGEPYNNDTQWLCRWYDNRWEYTHAVNVVSGPNAPTCPPPTESECKVFSDAAYQEGKTDGYATGYSEGQIAGHAGGYSEGYAVGYDEGVSIGYDDGREDGYNEGKADGVVEGTAGEQERIKDVLGLE